jgi:signal transduction histidine kinase
MMDLQQALRLFDETTGALSAQVRRLEEVLTAKQRELVAANARLEDKARELEAMSRWQHLVLGAVASGVVAVDADGTVTLCNDAAAVALAGVLFDPVGAVWREAFPDSPLLATLADGRARGYERSLPGRDGRPRLLSCRASAVRDPLGATLGAVEVFEDITEVRALRERAERADRLKQLGEMAAGVAHEIRNPLNGIGGFASLLARDLPADDPRQRFVQAIAGGVADLNRTVSGLLEFTRDRRIARRDTAPGALAAEVVALLRGELDARGADAAPVALDFVDGWRGGSIPLDAPQMRQVLLNLAQNAVHAVTEDRPQGGRVRLGLSAGEAGALVLDVDDDGPGVPEAERATIFTPFYTTRPHGTGLGLAISATIVQLHGGTITVETAPLGGARFRVTVPRG